MSYTAASHQGAIQMVSLHFWGAVVSAIFIYSPWYRDSAAACLDSLMLLCSGRLWASTSIKTERPGF